MSDRDRSRTKTIAVVGGGAFLLYLLLRHGKGWFGKSEGSAAAGRPTPPPRYRVRVSAAGITLNGQPTDIAGAVAAAQATGATVEVFATGDANYGQREGLIAALKAAAVPVLQPPR